MGRRRAGLVIALLLVSARGSGASSFYVARRVLETNLGRRRFYILGFYSILSCILWRLFMLLDLSYVDDMALLRCI